MNDIHITREDDAGNVVAHLKVPLTYAPKDKMLARIEQDPDLDRPTSIVLPKLAFELTNLFYDGTRKINIFSRVTRKLDDDPNKHKFLYQAVPYNFNFTLYAFVKNAEDGTKIVEQILPYFTPEWSAPIKLIPDMDVTQDIPVQIMSTRSEDLYEGTFTQRRAIVWTIDFMMKGFLWGPQCTSPIIKFANSNFYASRADEIADDVGQLDPVSRVTVEPGLTANGEPTSNAAASISRDLIEADDDWGWIITPSGEIINQ